MELTYPYILYGGVILAAILTIVTIGKSRKYKKGNKNAGIDIIDDIPHYRVLMIEYWILRFVAVVALITSIVLSSFIAAKPVKARMITNEVHNRDIFICLDVSTSLDGVNLQLLDKLRKMVSDLKGERFGIAIFNARTVMICPLTDDYEHVLDMINTLEDSINAGGEEYNPNSGATYEQYGYRFSGTLANDGRGSSFIGDGLVSCLYLFPDLDEEPDRSRLIVFVTDNDINGEPIVSITDACHICNSYGVKVFAIAPDFVVEEQTFSSAIEFTGGGYYNTRDRKAMDRMLSDVQKTNVNSSVVSYSAQVDVPDAAIITLICCVTVFIFCEWRLKL